jgi:hypothetical protein
MLHTVFQCQRTVEFDKMRPRDVVREVPPGANANGTVAPPFNARRLQTSSPVRETRH